VYTRPARPPRQPPQDPDVTEALFRDALIKAIDEDPRVRAAVLRLFASERAAKTRRASTTTASRTRRGA
jgi:hypothetical protein